MDIYIVVKQFTFRDVTYFKDKTLTVESLGAESVKRLEARNFIKPVTHVGDNVPENSGSGNHQQDSEWYLNAEDFLSEEELLSLERTQLLNYAAHIGLTGFKGNIGRDALRNLINEFIEKAIDEKDSKPPDENGNADDTGGE